MKRLRFLWWTYTVRGTDLAYVEVQRVRVGEGVLLGSLGPCEPVWPQRRYRVRPGHVHTVDRNRESVPLGHGDDVCDPPRHRNRILRLVDDSFELIQLAPTSLAFSLFGGIRRASPSRLGSASGPADRRVATPRGTGSRSRPDTGSRGAGSTAWGPRLGFARPSSSAS